MDRDLESLPSSRNKNESSQGAAGSRECWQPIESGARYLRLAGRAFLRHKGCYLPASAILALGIGMSVAMFSLVDAVLLKPLPFPEQESIHVIWKSDPVAGDYIGELAYPELIDLQESIRGFEHVAALPTSLYGYARVLQTGTAEPVQLESAPVSHDFFRVLGVSPALGRDFNSSDERVGAPPVVIVSDRTWRDHLDADPRIVGKTIRLNSQAHTVIGVMAPGVEFPLGSALWIPLGTRQSVVEGRRSAFLQAVGRTKPDYPAEHIAADVNALFERLAREYPEAYSRSQRAVVTPLISYWTGSARLHLLTMLAASLLLLAASAISAGTLLLTRTVSRASEIATRLALGARRKQIVGLLAAEGAVVGIAAALVGLGVAGAAIWALVQWSPAEIPRLSEAALNTDAYCFAAGAAAFVALACSLAPAWTASRLRLEAGIREGSAASSMPRYAGKATNLFVLAQSAATAVLLAVAVLLVLSYRAMTTADTGFAHHDALTMDATLRGPGLFPAQAFDRDEKRAFYSRLLDRLRETPGVVSAAGILNRPLQGPIGWEAPYEFEFEAGSSPRRVLPKANFQVITPDYFKTVGTPMIEGRDFNRHDSEESEPVVIISEALARHVRAAGHTPLGHRLRFGWNLLRWRKVIGICRDARYRDITRTGADVFMPSSQGGPAARHIAIRGDRPPRELASLVQNTVKAIDPTQVVSGIMTIGELIDRNAARHRFNMLLLLWFGVWAVVLAFSGIYSVISETVSARRTELAIKTALGAQKRRTVRDTVSTTVGYAVLGQVAGLLLVAAFGPLSSDLFYGVSARDPILLTAMGAFLFVTSVAAAFLPAWIAAGAEPQISLGAG